MTRAQRWVFIVLGTFAGIALGYVILAVLFSALLVVWWKLAP